VQLALQGPATRGSGRWHAGRVPAAAAPHAMAAPGAAAAVADGRAVVARNFPVAWVAPEAVGGLPKKVESLLRRIGALEGAPTVSQGPHGLEVVACFQLAASAREAVKTLHRFDLRSEAEKKAVNYADPKESERFFVQVVEPATAEAAAAGAAAGGAAASAAAAAAAPDLLPSSKKRIKVNGIYLQPLPENWNSEHVMFLASPYGTVEKVQLERLESGKTAALIDYKDGAHAQKALGNLDGLQLMGSRLSCTMQEEQEPPKPIHRFVMYLDELNMPSRPEVEPRLDDSELFLDIPQAARSEDAARTWLSGIAAVKEVFLVKDAKGSNTGKAYASFRNHPEALKALETVSTCAADGSMLQVRWSESERALKGTRGPYGLDILRRLCGEGDARLKEFCQAIGAISLAVGGNVAKPPTEQNGKTEVSVLGQQVHFVFRCEQLHQADECKSLLSMELARIHDTFSREVKGSLVLRGFPASWDQKGLKFVFAPFGGITGATLEEERLAAGHKESNGSTEDAAAKAESAARLAYVKLRNASATEKAVSNLHQTKVGDGDLVEECVVECHRWHLGAWSDGAFRASFFIDQLLMNRRPTEAGPSPEDRELFVKNLPLQDMNRQQLQEYFEGFGEVEDLYLIRDTFTGEPTQEGYVRFKQHANALRCIEALTPENEAESSDLTGWWSESERVLQRKTNCYRFNLISELVGEKGMGIESMKAEAKLEGLWLLAESLQQRDPHAPPRLGRQLHFLGRCTEEAHVKLFQEILESAVEDAHSKITERIERRKRKEQKAAVLAERQAAEKAASSNATAAAPPSQPPPGPEGWPGAPPGPGAGGQWPPPSGPPGAYWGGPGGPMGGPPPGTSPYDAYRYPGQAPPGAPGWGQPPAQPAGVSVFEQGASARPREDGTPQAKGRDGEERRRRKHRSSRDAGAATGAGGGREGGDEERRHGGEGGHKRRRRRHRSRSGGRAEDEVASGA